MKPILPLSLLSLLLIGACASQTAPSQSHKPRAHTSQKSLPINQTQADYLGLILAAEQSSNGKTRQILAEARKMTLFERAIIKGGCWDYLDAAWTRAGVPRNARKIVFQGNKNGNFAAPQDLRAGDWLYHINYSYNNIEHSGMFIGWVDVSRNLGVTLSYAGSHRHEPARYRIYDLSGVYQITRAR
ncbi:hypothetical protein ACKLNO_03045 [Neisseriaceae bacterium B1]